MYINFSIIDVINTRMKNLKGCSWEGGERRSGVNSRKQNGFETLNTANEEAKWRRRNSARISVLPEDTSRSVSILSQHRCSRTRSLVKKKNPNRTRTCLFSTGLPRQRLHENFRIPRDTRRVCEFPL